MPIAGLGPVGGVTVSNGTPPPTPAVERVDLVVPAGAEVIVIESGIGEVDRVSIASDGSYSLDLRDGSYRLEFTGFGTDVVAPTPIRITVKSGLIYIDGQDTPIDPTSTTLDVLGIEWILSNRQLDLPGLKDSTPANTPAPHRLYRRTTRLPRATFVTGTTVVTDKGQRLAVLGNPHHDPRQKVILEDPAARELAVVPGDGATEVVFRYHRDQEVALRVRTDKAGYLRLADPYDPGWTVTVNGQAQKLLVADHYLRAVYLSAGEHEVVFRYDGARVLWPQRLSMLTLLMLALAFMFSAWRPAVLDPLSAAPDSEGGRS